MFIYSTQNRVLFSQERFSLDKNGAKLQSFFDIGNEMS